MPHFNIRQKLTLTINNASLDKILKRIWQVDDYASFLSTDSTTVDDIESIEHFAKTIALYNFDPKSNQIDRKINLLKTDNIFSEEDIEHILDPTKIIKNPKYIFEAHLNLCKDAKTPNDFHITLDRAKSLFKRLQIPKHAEVKKTYLQKINTLLKMVI